ncbi:hypothetical protein CT0861_01592 [Colletotrichum tofieldiae]|uniref:Uncharacterized protein n=1 Tax=Colletotrichum tofieldiae TaxID=708197 RepID=A0A161V528_9PEZI|nr:hypothetical protein CT0861_01592 [Colletotrichum tofieldiae]
MKPLSVLLLGVAGSLSKAQLVLGDKHRDGGDQPFNVAVNARVIAEVLTVLTSTVSPSSPLITPKPMVVAERDVSLLQVETLGSNTCGFFMLSKDSLSMTRTRICDDIASSCAASGSYLGCGARPHTTCFNGKEPVCASSARPGEQTLCCHKTRNLNGECQTFIRDDGALGEKMLLGCREADIVWDLIVSLKTATDQFSGASTTVATSAVPISSMPSDTPSPSTPTLPATSAATPATATGKSTNSNDSTHPHTGAIVGGVLGGLAILAIASCVAVWLVVRRRRASALNRGSDGHLSPSPSHELPGDQPCVPPKEGAEEHCSYEALSPASTSREIHQVPANDAVGSPMKPAELD